MRKSPIVATIAEVFSLPAIVFATDAIPAAIPAAILVSLVEQPE